MTSSFLLRLLPVELIAKIFGDYDFTKHDLMNFRLVCKAICPWATQRLAKDYLSKICVFMTRKDLDVLTKICEHPDMGPYVRSIQIDNIRIHPLEIERVAEVVSKACKRKSIELMREASECLQNSLSRYTEETELEQSQEATRLLTCAFAQVKSHGHPLSLVSADSQNYGIDPEHDKITNGYLKHYFTTITTSQSAGTLEIMHQAACASGAQIDGLHISACVDSGTHIRDDLMIPVANTQVHQKIYSQLKRLTFETGAIFIETPHERLMQLLKATTCLETFRLNLLAGPDCGRCIYMKEVRFGRDILDSVSSDSLSDIELWNLSVPEQTLISFLDRHHTTIRRLTIASCALKKGSWSSVLSWIYQNTTKLQYLCLRELCKIAGRCPEGCGRQYTEDRIIKGDFDVEGRVAVQRALERLTKTKM